MKLETRNQGLAAVISIRGELTADHVDTLHRLTAAQLQAGEARDFVIDLAETPFIDSRGLETLLALQETCAEQLGQVRLASPDPSVQEILRITRLAGRLTSSDSVDAALASLA